MNQLTILDLFSGIGGFSYAAEHLVGGFQTIAFCDSDEPCRKVLRKHWPKTPIFTDVRSLQAKDIQPLCPNGLSLITAGFPCQDLSVAGKQAGYDGERSVLFYEIIRLARELRPDFLLLENVRNLLSHQNGETFQETLFQIAKAGYDAEWAVIPASDLGACHKRERIWIVAHTNGGRQQKQGLFLSTEERSGDGMESVSVRSSGSGESADHLAHTNEIRPYGQDLSLSSMCGSDERGEIELGSGSGTWTQQWKDGDSRGKSLNPEWTAYVSQPVLCRGDDGLSNRVDRLKQLGNSIVPQVAAVPLLRIKELALQGHDTLN